MTPQSTTPTQTAAKRHRRITCFLGLSVVVPLTTLLSILTLAFATDASASYRNFTDRGTVTTFSALRPDAQNGGLEIALYPLYLDLGPVDLRVAGASLSLALALSIGLLCVFVHRRSKALLLAAWQRYLVFLALTTGWVLSLAAFVSCAVRHFQSGTFEPGYRSPSTNLETYGPGGKYDGAKFDLGSWTCQLSAYGAFQDNRDVVSRQCTDATAAFWLGLALVLLDMAMAGLVWMDWRGQRVLFRNYRAFKDEYEMDYI
ncbi:uncharacterized protein PG998_011656 [Apiospora kogelbergensis]|uniref:uncharacterized protein n=1 Tax=Apiospora kogelbergensis TaxID=1337665 RepID=UPI003130F4C7